MKFFGGADSDQMKIMVEALDKHCAAYGLEGESDRQEVARLAMYFYESGSDTVEALLVELAKHYDHENRWQA